MLQEIRLVDRLGQLWLTLLWLVALLFILFAPARFAMASTTAPIMFVTQPPFGGDFASVNAVFGNHRGDTGSGPRGGDLYIRYPDGSLRNLTAAAGYGSATGQEIGVREPTVHWSGTKAVFSMVIGGTIKNNYAPVYWQIYEVSGLGPTDPVQITRLPQPADSNNVSPLYGTDDRILFTCDRPRNADRTTYPQLDEYESTPTVTGIWSMNADGSDLRLLDHAVSGDFTPTIASDGRIVFTRWDHLQRDQQNNEGTLSYGAFNYVSESSTQALSTNAEIFPELRTQPAGSYTHGHRFNFFFPWQMNEDGTGLETLNHLGRHELGGYFDSSHNGLPEFIAPQGRRIADLLLQLREDPTRPGYFYATKAPEFTTHASGQIIGIFAPESVNADAMQIDYITDPISQSVVGDGQTPPANHPGHFRNPVALSDGSLIAVRTSSPFADRATAGALSSRYDFHLIYLDPSLSYRTVGARLLANPISKSISYWDNYSYTQLSYSGPLWELDPVEVRARPRPARHTNPLPAIETQILTQELGGTAGINRLRAFLEARSLALIVSRNVTRRADKQQDFNLRIAGTSTQTAQPGVTPLDVAFMQFLQGDLIRGYSNFQGGRRVLGQLMHDGLLPSAPSAPPSSVVLADDGSMAAFVPAQRAMTWQMLTPNGTPAVRERYWLTFAPGEMRLCTNCHGINTTDVVLQQPPPTNPPVALRQLAQWWRSNFDTGSGPITPSPTPTLTPIPPNTPAATSTPSRTSAVPPTPTRSATRTATPSAAATLTATATRPPTSTPTLTFAPTRTPTGTQIPSRTHTFTRTPTRPATQTFTPTRSATQTVAPTRTATRSATRTPSLRLPTPTATRVLTPAVSGRVLWLDASQIVGLGDGSAVMTWPDRSGGARHATQPATTLRPTYRQAGLNGRPSVRFDGVDDYLRMASPLLSGSTARTVVFVARPTAVGNRGIIDLGDGRASGGAFMITPEYGVRVLGGKRLFQRSAGGGAEIGVITLSGATTDSIAALINGVTLSSASTVSLAINTTGSGTVGTFTAIPVNQHNFAGDIAEILVYNRVLSAAEIDTVQRYLSAKYTIALP